MNSKISIIVFLVISVMVSGCINTNIGENKSDYRLVTEVIDADTVKVNSTSGTETVRLIGMDAPETFGENNPHYFELENNEENKQCLDDWAIEADNYLENMIEGEVVSLEKDELEGPRDQYGRKLAYVVFKDKPVGKDLLEKGYATVFPTDFKYREEYQSLENEAKQQEIGVWSC